MHVADPLSRRSDHYVSSADDNKDQVLLDPVSVKTVEVSDRTHEERQVLITDFTILLWLDIRVSKLHTTHSESTIYGRG